MNGRFLDLKELIPLAPFSWEEKGEPENFEWLVEVGTGKRGICMVTERVPLAPFCWEEKGERGKFELVG